MDEFEWIEPKTDYKAQDQVTPTIFNNLGISLKHVYELKLDIKKQDKDSTTVPIKSIVFVEE